MLKNGKWHYGIRIDIIQPLRKMCFNQKNCAIIMWKIVHLYSLIKNVNRCMVLINYSRRQSVQISPILCELSLPPLASCPLCFVLIHEPRNVLKFVYVVRNFT
jgi:hypothetical protein